MNFDAFLKKLSLLFLINQNFPNFQKIDKQIFLYLSFTIMNGKFCIENGRLYVQFLNFPNNQARTSIADQNFSRSGWGVLFWSVDIFSSYRD